MFVFPLFVVVLGVFSQLCGPTLGAPLEDDFKNSVEAQRIRDALAMDNFQNLSPQQWQLLSYLLSPARMSKRDDDLPPGFIGVRGRRSNMDPALEEFYRKMMSHPGQNMLISPAEAKGLIKKGDNTNVYKDGFLGVRG